MVLFLRSGVAKCFGAAAVLCLIVAIAGCSSDEEDDSMIEEVVSPEEVIEPKPLTLHWHDGTVQIRVTGRFDDSRDALHLMWAMDMKISKALVPKMAWDNLPLRQERYEKNIVEVSVISMTDVGIEEPVTMEEVWDHYQNAGYRPLTMEEAIELRIQFQDQPPVSSGEPMSAFFVLLSKKDATDLGGMRKMAKENTRYVGVERPKDRQYYRIWALYHMEVEINRYLHGYHYPPLEPV